jgi:transcriptional regulator with XRE-family HTH domain
VRSLVRVRDEDWAVLEGAYQRGLGRPVRMLRLKRELSQEQIARASGISRNFVSSIERGAHGVDIVRLLRLAKLLRVGIEKLVTEADPADDDW